MCLLGGRSPKAISENDRIDLAVTTGDDRNCVAGNREPDKVWKSVHDNAASTAVEFLIDVRRFGEDFDDCLEFGQKVLTEAGMLRLVPLHGPSDIKLCGRTDMNREAQGSR